ncbi:MAG: hypothetical protein IJ407_01425 [Clostridia bacterium]|nr:hypothetical protein [Clostridia bacterium]
MNNMIYALSAAPQLAFNPMNFVKMLQYMGIGMLVIFVIIGVIILTTLLINKIFSKKN